MNYTVFNSTPQIDDVEIDREANTAAVYFPIKKENFYFVIYIENLEVNWMGMSAGNGVCLFAYLLVQKFLVLKN